jgi:nitric oxide dioxygenase
LPLTCPTHLFEIAPALRPLFREDMRDQKRKLFVMIAMALQGLRDLDRLLPQVKVRARAMQATVSSPSTTRSSGRR